MYATPFASIKHAEDFIEDNDVIRTNHPNARPKWVSQEYDITESCYFIDLGGSYCDFGWTCDDFNNWEESERVWHNYVAGRTKDEWEAILMVYLPGNPHGPYWPEGQAELTRMAIAKIWGQS